MENIRQQLASSIALISRLPPSKLHKNQVGLIRLVPQLEDNLLESIDLPLGLETDPQTGEPFIKTEFNRDGNSYRSPYSNQYVPPEADAYLPSQAMRKFEENIGLLFKEYTKLYYEGGVGNFFVSENEEGFNCGYFAKKDSDKTHGFDANWNSYNVMTVRFKDNQNVVYTINTTVMVEMKIANEKLGEANICGYRRDHAEEVLTLPANQKQREAFHIANIGRMIEDMETKVRTELDFIYISRTQGIVSNIRYLHTRAQDNQQRQLADKLINMRQ